MDNQKMKNLKPLGKLFYYKHFVNFFINSWVILLPNKILSNNCFHRFLDDKNADFVSFFPHNSLIQIVTKSAPFCFKNILTNLGSFTIREYRQKILLKNIETMREITISSGDKQT